MTKHVKCSVFFNNCGHCEKLFTARQGCHKYCSPQCRRSGRNAEALQWQAQYKLRHGHRQCGVRTKHKITCAQCGTEAHMRAGARHCSRKCANKSNQAAMTSAATAARIAARQRRRLPVIYTGTPCEPATHEPIRRHRQFKSGQCRVCSTWFVSLNTDQTCSKECWLIKNRQDRAEHKSRRRTRKIDAYVADVWRKQVFERDGYRCHLCRKKTLPTKQAPHPRSPTIDHVIPLAAGGTHEPLNCRTACFLCNCKKSDGGGGEQLLLIA